MGAGIGRFFGELFRLGKGKEQRIVMLGLDNGGKTTILYRLKMGEVVKTTPTIGTSLSHLLLEIRPPPPKSKNVDCQIPNECVCVCGSQQASMWKRCNVKT